MANRRTYADVINPGNNPNSQYQNQQTSFVLDDQRQQSSSNVRSADEIRNENEKLKMMIAQMQRNKPNLQEQIVEEGGIPNEFNKRIEYNAEKIRDLQDKVREQEEVMKAYQDKFSQFEDNLMKIMRLDKDIHSKLVNPQQSSTLEKNVKNVMLALNSGASYDKVLNMIDSIRV